MVPYQTTIDVWIISEHEPETLEAAMGDGYLFALRLALLFNKIQ